MAGAGCQDPPLPRERSDPLQVVRLRASMLSRPETALLHPGCLDAVTVAHLVLSGISVSGSRSVSWSCTGRARVCREQGHRAAQGPGVREPQTKTGKLRIRDRGVESDGPGLLSCNTCEGGGHTNTYGEPERLPGYVPRAPDTLEAAQAAPTLAALPQFGRSNVAAATSTPTPSPGIARGGAPGRQCQHPVSATVCPTKR